MWMFLLDKCAFVDTRNERWICVSAFYLFISLSHSLPIDLSTKILHPATDAFKVKINIVQGKNGKIEKPKVYGIHKHNISNCSRQWETMFIIIHVLTHTHITTMANAVAELKVKVSFGHCTMYTVHTKQKHLLQSNS